LLESTLLVYISFTLLGILGSGADPGTSGRFLAGWGGGRRGSRRTWD